MGEYWDEFYTQHPNGSTRLATEAQAQPLSRGYGPVATLGNTVIRFPEQEPSIVFGGAGCGKGTQLGLYQPVHDSTESFLFVDPAGGQALSVTHHWNLAQGRETYVMNPFGVSAYPNRHDALNLWGILQDDDNLLENAKAITAMSIREQEKEGENSWVRQGAQRWARQLKILHVRVAGRITPRDFWQLVNRLDSDDQAIKDWASLAEGQPYQLYETLVEIYTKKTETPKEYSAIMGCIKDNYDALTSPKVADAVSGDVDYLSYLPRRDKKVGIYYTIPGGSSKNNMWLTRNMVGIGQLHCVRANSGSRPLFYIEEAACVGGADFIKSGVSEYRKYMRLILIYQSLGQLTHHFGKSGAQEILDSCGLQIYMAVRDFDSAKRLSDTVGKTTIAVDDPVTQAAHANKAEAASLAALFEGADPLKAAQIYRHEQALSRKQRKAGRDVLDPAELLRQSRQVLIVAPGTGVLPILADKLPPYFLNPAMSGRWAPDLLFPPLDRVRLPHRLWGSVQRPFIRCPVPPHLAHWPNNRDEIAYIKGYRTW